MVVAWKAVELGLVAVALSAEIVVLLETASRVVVVLKFGLVALFAAFELKPEGFLSQLEQHWFDSEMVVVVAAFALSHLLVQYIHLVDLLGPFVFEFLEKHGENEFFLALPAFFVESAVSALLLATDSTAAAGTVFHVRYLS